MTQQQPLFPQPIPIIGGCGEFASGKTLFGLTIDPKNTLVYDLEKSSESYTALGFTRIDVPLELQKRYPNGYKPLQVFEWWRDHVRSIPAGRYRAVMADPATDIESGVTEWVRNNAGYFGRTAAQYQKMSGLLWGDMKELWKALLADLASRCEVFYFTVHMGSVWEGDRPVPGKRKPKGKSTLMELASLFLHFERKSDAKGNIAPKPAAVVLKSRLAHTRVSDDGEISIIPALPPRLPVATPAAIRQYMNHPPDYTHLKPEEQAPEQLPTDDDRAAVRLATAEAERDAEALKLERVQRQQEAEERNRQRKEVADKQRQEHENERLRALAQAALNSRPTTAVASSAAPAAAASPPPPVSSAPTANGNGKSQFAAFQGSQQRASFSAHAITEEQLKLLGELRTAYFQGPLLHAADEARKDWWKAVLAKRNVDTARALTQDQAAELIAKLRAKLDVQAMDAALNGQPEANGAEVKEGETAAAASGG